MTTEIVTVIGIAADGTMKEQFVYCREVGMARRKNQNVRDVRRNLRASIANAVAEAFPDCLAEFSGGVERSRMAKLGPTLGFRVKDARGKYRSNIIWVNPEYEGSVSAKAIARMVKETNG